MTDQAARVSNRLGVERDLLIVIPSDEEQGMVRHAISGRGLSRYDFHDSWSAGLVSWGDAELGLSRLTFQRVVSIRTAPPLVRPRLFYFDLPRTTTMKVRSSLKSLKTRHRDCKVVRRKGKVYVINKTDPRFKAKQG